MTDKVGDSRGHICDDIDHSGIEQKQAEEKQGERASSYA